MEPREFHWPMSSFYSRLASLIQPAYTEIARRADIPAGTMRVLDVGGGDGRLAVVLASMYPDVPNITTADVAGAMAELARKRIESAGLSERVRSDVQDVHRLTYEDGAFDFIISFGSMHHWRDPAAALRELDRVLSPGGRFAIGDGYGRPAFKEIKESVARFGGTTWTALAYWLGSKDALSLDEVEKAVDESGVAYLKIEAEGPKLEVTGTKPMDARSRPRNGNHP
jgi:ubiquinone/menaquinone biosynthesis C-methylase UbiE